MRVWARDGRVRTSCCRVMSSAPTANLGLHTAIVEKCRDLTLGEDENRFHLIKRTFSGRPRFKRIE